MTAVGGAADVVGARTASASSAERRAPRVVHVIEAVHVSRRRRHAVPSCPGAEQAAAAGPRGSIWILTRERFFLSLGDLGLGDGSRFLCHQHINAHTWRLYTTKDHRTRTSFDQRFKKSGILYTNHVRTTTS